LGLTKVEIVPLVLTNLGSSLFIYCLVPLVESTIKREVIQDVDVARGKKRGYGGHLACRSLGIFAQGT
jgi:hypothetical protein